MLFAAINMLSMTFVVLIVGGLSIVTQTTFAHAYTNTLQGLIMVVISAVIVAGLNMNEIVEGLGPPALRFDRDAKQLGLANPAMTSTYGIFASLLVAPPSPLWRLMRARDRMTGRRLSRQQSI